MRPALPASLRQLRRPQDRSAIRLAAVVELLHSATLIHDDVIDSADTRRGRPSANSKWGNHRSVLDWRLVVHAVLSDGFGRAQFPHSRHSDRLDSENGRRGINSALQKSAASM